VPQARGGRLQIGIIAEMKGEQNDRLVRASRKQGLRGSTRAGNQQHVKRLLRLRR
jgi:hypothetical protein